MKQTDLVLDYMKRYKTITAFDALRDLGIMRLASRISELRKGHNIEKIMITVKTRMGTANIAQYRLIK